MQGVDWAGIEAWAQFATGESELDEPCATYVAEDCRGCPLLGGACCGVNGFDTEETDDTWAGGEEPVD